MRAARDSTLMPLGVSRAVNLEDLVNLFGCHLDVKEAIQDARHRSPTISTSLLKRTGKTFSAVRARRP
jgi:hypothetical protein